MGSGSVRRIVRVGVAAAVVTTGVVWESNAVQAAAFPDIDNVAYALSQVSFLSDAQSDACTLYTVVSDLGNNGLPLQYIGDPPTGVEVPFLGIPPIDIVETQIEVGDLRTIEVNLDPATQTAAEGTTATATIVIDPPTHPAFDLRWSTVAGTATAGVDYQNAADVMISVPENAATVQISTAVLDDADPEADETFLFDLTLPTDPPGSPSGSAEGSAEGSAQDGDFVPLGSPRRPAIL